MILVCCQMQADESDDLEAITALEAQIEATASSNGPFSGTLFEPLVQLATLQLDFGLREEGIDTLRRAQNIAHRNEGVYSPRQLEIVETLTTLALQDEAYEEANRSKKFSFFVTQHAYPEGSPEVLNAQREISKWFMYTGQTRRARQYLKEAIDSAEKNGHETLNFRLLENEARLIEGNCCNPKYLIKALEKSDDEVLAETRHEVYMAIADAYFMGGKSKRAGEYLAQANEITPLNSAPKALTYRRTLTKPFSEDKDTYRFRDNLPPGARRLERMTREEVMEESVTAPQWFLFDPEKQHQGFSTRDTHETYDKEKRTYAMVGHPILFSEKQLDWLLPIRWKNNKEELRVEVTFNVTETGNLEDIQIAESNAPTKLNRLITKALRKIYYRPALENGIPVETSDVSIVQTFFPRNQAANEG